jgi:hypothetical protein
MSQIDADLFERVLLRQSQAAQGKFQVLEWGAGRSTLYFTARLRETDLSFNWLTLEYDRGYIEREIAPKLAGQAGVRLTYPEADPPAAMPDEQALEIVAFDKGPLQPYLEGHDRDRLADLDAYVAYPAGLGRRFDFIFVDGRKRRRCLIEAAQLLKPNGVVILHDAYRRHYQCAFENYRSKRMLGEILWIGTQHDTDFLEWIG